MEWKIKVYDPNKGNQLSESACDMNRVDSESSESVYKKYGMATKEGTNCGIKAL